MCEKNMEEEKKRKKEYLKNWKNKNKEKQKEYNKKYMIECKKKNSDKFEEYKENNRHNCKKYKENNKEKIKQTNIEYRKNNKEKIYEANKKYYDSLTPEQKEERRIKNNQRQKERREKDPLYKLKGNVSSLIRQSIKLKGYIKESRTHEILGCSFEELKQHLENQFTEWMSWDNYGNPVDGLVEPNKTWDIDHIIPLSNAKDDKELLELNHYTNLQPLCSYDNRFIKRDNI